MSDVKEESIRVVTFSGKKASWPAWEEKFLARAKRKGYKDVLIGKTAVVKDTIVIADADVNKAEKLKARELNEQAYADLILSIDAEKAAGKVVFNIVKGTKSEDYPDGHANMAWERLKKKFAPTTAPNRSKLHKLFYGAKLKKGVDPSN